MYVRVLTSNRLALGPDPINPVSVIDLSEETVIPYAAADAQQSSTSNSETARGNETRFARRSGDYWFEIKGKRTHCGSLKELLAEALKNIEVPSPERWTIFLVFEDEVVGLSLAIRPTFSKSRISSRTMRNG